MADSYTGKLLRSGRNGPPALDSDVLVRVMAFAWPREAAVLAQSCKELHKAYGALKASLNLDQLHQLSRHQLTVYKDRAYISLPVPGKLITLASPHLTAANIHAVVLALRPEMGQLQQYVQRMFHDRTSTNLTVDLQVPCSSELVCRRFAVAPILHAFADIVTRDLKLVISSHAQHPQGPERLNVSYQTRVSIDPPYRELYEGIKQRLGQDVRDDLLEIEYDQCPESGAFTSSLCWVHTGLPALFRSPHSWSRESWTKHGRHVVISTINVEESNLSPCK